MRINEENNFVNIIVILTLVIVLEILIRYLNIVSLQGFDKEFFISENNITLNKPYSKNLVVAGKELKLMKMVSEFR